MGIALLVKQVRECKGLSQEDLAVSVGVTQATWSKYENGKVHMPNDVVNEAIKALKDPRLKVQYGFLRRSNLFNTPLLDNVDDNILVGLDSLIEEAKELTQSCELLKKILKNKRGREDLLDEEWGQVLKHEEQIVDMFPALKLHLTRMVEVYKLDLEELEKRSYNKLKERKYIK